VKEESSENVVFRNPVQKFGFAQMAHLMGIDPELSDGAYRTYARYIKYAQQKGQCFPGAERMARDRKKTRVTISRHTAELVRLGYITRERRLGTSSMTYIEDVNQIPRLIELAKQADTGECITDDTNECIPGNTAAVSRPIPKEEEVKDKKVKNKPSPEAGIISNSDIENSESEIPNVPKPITLVKDSAVLKQTGPRVKITRPPAADVFREETHRWPRKSWWPDLAEKVGAEPDALDRWRAVVHAYLGLGWNPMNVKGMLEWFDKDEVPHVRGVKRNARGNRKHEAATPGTVRAFADYHPNQRQAAEVEETRPG